MIQNIYKEHTVEEWDVLGFLTNISDGRKEFLADCFNYTIVQIADSDHEHVKSFALPIIYRIGKNINITHEDIDQIVDDIRKEYPVFIENGPELWQMVNVDAEVMFCSEFAEAKTSLLLNKYKIEL